MMLIGDGVTMTFLLPTGASVVAEVLQEFPVPVQVHKRT